MVWVCEADAPRFGMGPDMLLGRDHADQALAHALDSVADGLTESRELWGRRLPLCPRHPDAHPLRIDIRPTEVVGVCPTAGPVRVVPR